jgi:hypothetical protein
MMGVSNAEQGVEKKTKEKLTNNLAVIFLQKQKRGKNEITYPCMERDNFECVIVGV